MKDFSNEEWGLVLNGGGGKGSYQIGVFKALFEHHINDCIIAVSGTSSGALNSVLFANGDLNVAVNAWQDITPKSFLQVSPEMVDFKEGLVPRDGLLDIFKRYIDFDVIRMSDKTIYATVTDFGPVDSGSGTAKYYRLNYKPANEIKDILLASSALPIIYEPIVINGNICRDGGLTDNMPIEPLYIEGIRHFIVVGLSENTEINKTKYPDAEFLLINPRYDIGNFIDGTLDFTSKGARKRMELGYIDAIRQLEFYGQDMSFSEVKFQYDQAVQREYNRFFVEEKKRDLEDMVNTDMDKLNGILNLYMGD